MNKNSIGLIIAGSLVLIFGVIMLFSGDKPLGGSTSDSWTVGGDLNVTGGTNLTGAVSATTDMNLDDSNSTTTVSLGNTGVGKICLWNGANYSIISYASSSATTSVVTSTTCQ